MYEYIKDPDLHRVAVYWNNQMDYSLSDALNEIVLETHKAMNALNNALKENEKLIELLRKGKEVLTLEDVRIQSKAIYSDMAVEDWMVAVDEALKESEE
jgi:hypothetical protein